MLDLLMWNLVNKLGILNPFKIFLGTCKACKRKNSEIFVDFYLDKEIKCRKCKLKAIFLTKLISISLNLVCHALKMPNGQFKRILRENISIRRLLESYIEGIGIFGLKIPQISAGPIITIWSITDKCNLNCSHCYIHKNTGNKELTYDEACNVIDQLYKAKNLVVGFTGGEPLLREDIFDLIKYISEKSMSTALATNGILISPSIAQKLKYAGLGYIQISIDGLEQLHDKSRGKGSFQNAIQGIKNCLDAGLYVSMDVVITKLNANQIYELVDLAKELKVQKLELLDFVPSQKAVDKEHYALSPLQVEKFGYLLCNIWEKLMKENYPLTISYKNPIFNKILAQRMPNSQVIPFFKGGFPKNALKYFNFSERLSKGIFSEQTPFSPFITGCESGVYVIHIKPNGEVTPCPLNPRVIGSVKKNNIQDIWLHSPVLNEYRNLQFEGECGKCIYKIICGGCRAKVFIFNKSLTKSDPTCILNNINNY
ncbi:MAG: radical SAM/SPASM domain-containing protein [Promethearchaeota archaeon]